MATTTLTREEQIDRYVATNAAELFFVNLMQGLEGETELCDRLGQLFPPQGLDEDMFLQASGRLGDELWPTEADFESDEYNLATARSDALVARAFAMAATADAREVMVERAARFAGFAAKKRFADVVPGDR